jgi:putative glutamine amidotransferase
MQVLNVLRGGTLVQDIGNDDHWKQFTATELDSGSRIAKAMGTDRPERCHCVHHQALDRLGDGLHVVGHHADGLIHAVELDAARWVVGTQWHPEDSADTDPQQQGLFDELIRQAS